MSREKEVDIVESAQNDANSSSKLSGKYTDSDEERQKEVTLREDDIEESPARQRLDEDAEVIKDRGVYRVESLKKVLYSHEKGLQMRVALGVSILLCAWASSLDSSVTNSLKPWATSAFNQHSMGLGTLAIAVQIIGSIAKPVWARIANIVSRPATYMVSVIFYSLGYVIVASSNTISAYIVGSALASAGSAGITFLNRVIVADMTSLKWRALATSSLSTPYIINTWYAGYIVSDLGPTNWRWGYGMFCIIMPVVLSPATVIMTVFESKAHKYLDNDQSTEYKEEMGFQKNWKKLIWRVIIEVDALGLILLGFAFSLLLLPFSLYKNADDQWRNPSLIAMFVVGGVLLAAFFAYEFMLAPFPILPRRSLNRTLVASIVIDFFYQLAGMVPAIYFSSFAWIVKDWNNRDWTYFNNTKTLTLCVFGLVAGVCMRLSHRYKIWQFFGVTLAIVGSGIMIDGRTASDNTLRMVWSHILSGIAGGFNVNASNVALQASVPHRDMAVSMSILSLSSSIGSSVGSAISSAIWQGKMEAALRKHMPDSVTDKQVKAFFSNISTLRKYEFDSDIRQAGIRAYREVNFYFYPIAVGLQGIRLLAVCFQSNFFLGDTQNAVEDEEGIPITVEEQKKRKEERETEGKKKKSWKKILFNIED
ncbi:hypothetical protein FT663_04115 [Candidozyma haemuli var. vulneris]|uniref:Major facilitator superfamily (MFS) profile domain-containing protein n=1 Tax=Candidozyma haemuli TaxID=45357 RepID=A0A2V1AYC7_9ASCO|nr:hypothetical protein CXQ85_004931 [[Candida] haemuloni]KAF3986952.1 hypothetical protein FT662_04272 [[Candida] haemuloni var. vulneris]KAF3988230.1 hypothetical protein FT663_04115 [[Candida] haemuloni var. vulneris]PVH22363.1 hypothetical protein CXQ85_004931 [[Candida] haemuloni]